MAPNTAASNPSEAMDKSLNFIMGVLSTCETLKPNYRAVATKFAICDANTAQKKFKKLVEQGGYTLVKGAIIAPDGENGNDSVGGCAAACASTAGTSKKKASNAKNGSTKAASKKKATTTTTESEISNSNSNRNSQNKKRKAGEAMEENDQAKAEEEREETKEGGA